MRRFYLLCSVGILGVGSLTGCSAFRSSGPDCGCNRPAPAAPACAPSPPAKLFTAAPPPLPPAAVKSEDKVEPPRGEVITFPPPVAPAPAAPVVARPVANPAAAPVPPRVETPPRLPGPDEYPALPAPPPPQKTSTLQGPMLTDKILIVSNLVTSPEEGRIIDVAQAVKPAPVEMPATRTGPTVPTASEEKAAASGRIVIGHDAAFAVVTGQVQVYRKAHRLRYAEIDQEDIYGGVLTLESNIDLTQLHDGKYVRVRGALLPPIDRTQGAHFRVTSIEWLD